MIHWVLLRLSGVDRKKDAARVFVTPTPWDRPATGADWRRQGGGHEAPIYGWGTPYHGTSNRPNS